MRQPLVALASLVLALTAAAPAIAQGAGASRPPAANAATSGTPWSSLTAQQQTALDPLKEHWHTLSASHQRKWLALARNYHRLPPAEQATLQRRMSEWAQLSPSQRARARLNFNEVRRVPTDEKRAKWEQYQALPEQERERLASDRPKPPVTIAPALRPTPPSPISRPVRAASSPPEDSNNRGLRINVPLNRNTLLPLTPAPEGARR
ncbi:DUF3106 domain-containing protein [Ottowia sp.]|uniref:DUF3106 domain-containing protein n=1 Tax=Ottowia sp. TaxID=1898956 RepID=UPI002B8FE362|nr:DUF3106 domain-containing protein [Pseudomonadota bacterium]HOV18650.1 DUF3106 domain-containing protein [Ottowia sp.]